MEDTIVETLEETFLKKTEREEEEETSKGLQEEPVEESSKEPPDDTLVWAFEHKRVKKPLMVPSKPLEE
ncbi:hypothetical protein H5410_063064 [Solanum commersonii]|uniref:Uncharacterized protein n=1 Tax=Solanum commersonii TaxID=4109 RepID=A0A9J5WCH9_SOLCO|nr:hypothetical protein H5410_063064 [Solanum commersonii]